jgi:hypothetical protein
MESRSSLYRQDKEHQEYLDYQLHGLYSWLSLTAGTGILSFGRQPLSKLHDNVGEHGELS